jgi:hypothetical protein
MSQMTRKIRPRQIKAINYLLSGETITDTAQLVGVGRRTLHRWLDDPVFKAELTAKEAEILETVTRKLLRLAGDAVDTLGEVMNNANKPGANWRRLAAVSILELVLRLREITVIEERLARLELANERKK